MIYFDNAATGGFKPHAVTHTVENCMRYLLANPGRSGHRLSVSGAKIVYNTREILGEFFNATPDRVIFTKNCTEALNFAIFGSIKEGGHVITTAFEHNSVLRPLHALKERGIISLDIVYPSFNKSIIEKIKEKIQQNTYLIITTALSNVTGEVLPIEQIGRLAKKHQLLYFVDGAQGGGHIGIDVKKCGISCLALAGHKGLYGIMGSGVLILDDQMDLEPIIYGGTGSESFNLNQPLCYPERLESGTLNLPAIAGLFEGIRYIKNNLSTFSEHLISSSELLIDGLKSFPHITCYSNPNPAGIVSFKFNNLTSSEVADVLNREYDIAVRGGFHCAPLVHKMLDTSDCGLVRASLAVQNSTREIHSLLSALSKIKY